MPFGPRCAGPIRAGGMEERSMETVAGIVLIIIAAVEIIGIIRVVSTNTPIQA